ncbi:tRNA(Ile)-lysidine synthase [Deinobacterium chartae]|uniref:Multifunctional fusion protein n=1 Tax=Deinobacterium chartae TaxID=521158 RepID=A0A841HU07_9DEIO|nr:tRNA(Ile)-lysidine synthase [Deinobacterium chartae]
MNEDFADLLDPLRALNPRPLVAVSGGADSVALLRALLEAGSDPVAAHFDHRLRPGSGEDAGFVRDLCAQLGVPLELGGADVRRVAQAKGWGLEDAARRLRYGFLARAARARGIQGILTAHTREDQAETVLMQLLRGTHKAVGIPPRRGALQRPWLTVSRDRARSYLSALGQPHREDPSNADPAFTRNWLRLEVMPRLRTRFPAADAALARYAAWALEDEALLAALTDAVSAHAEWSSEPPAVRRRLFARVLRAAGVPFDAAHLQALLAAGESGVTRHFTLPGDREVTVTRGRPWIAAPEFARPDFDYPAHWTLRHRRPGDRIRLPGGTRKLSDVLTDLKLPRGWRDAVWLLAEGAQVHWVGLTPPLWSVDAGSGRTPWWDEMGLALDEARLAAQAGEVPIGAVVVCDGQVIARARNRSREHGDMTRHAELEALRQAATVLGTPYLNRCALVVTLEPCPMCLGAALEARVGQVVYGARNLKMGALGGVMDLTRAHWGARTEVTGAVRAREAGALLEEFFAGLRSGG